jgi:hypothetical protein
MLREFLTARLAVRQDRWSIGMVLAYPNSAPVNFIARRQLGWLKAAPAPAQDFGNEILMLRYFIPPV